MATDIASAHRSAAGSGQNPVARVDIIRDMAAAETLWRALENERPLLTPYQRFDLLHAWQTHVGIREGLAPLIVVASDHARRPLLLLPFATRRENGTQVARFLGGKHVTFNMGLWRRDFAASATKEDLDRVLAAIGAAGVDVLALTQQPWNWRGIANPLALYPGQPSANGCPLLRLAPNTTPEQNVSNSFRRRLRSKERKLRAEPGFRYYLASNDDDINRLLDAFFIIKQQRMAEQNLPDVFADPGVKDFIRRACHTELPGGGRAIAIHALECDAEVVAFFAGVADGERFSMMFNTYTLSANAKHSPGLILLRDIIDHYAEQGYATLDLGIGSDEYKRLFCKDDEPVFDSFIPLSARGRLAALGLSSLTHAKRIVKQNPALMQMASRLRAALRR